MSSKVYDTLKIMVQIVLPALGTLYFALSQVWGFSYGEEVIGTITAITAFLGTCLKIDSMGYYKKLEDNGSEEEVIEEEENEGE